jgi:predicted nuclease of predicted toxin-antitoxin system
MPVGLYFDHHVPSAITAELRRRQVDVLTAIEDGTATLSDPDILERASALERVLFSQDTDLLAEGTRRQNENIPFAGVLIAHQVRVSIGACIRDLALIARVLEPADLRNQVIFLPL